jgi:type I restriction enzyme S subunit
VSQSVSTVIETSQATLAVAPLPYGWRWVQLKEVCERIDYGFTASADFKLNEPRFLRITDIQNGRVDWEQVPGCKINANEEYANRLADGDIVFARTGGTTGKSFLIRDPPRAVFASYLIRLRPTDDVDSDFLYGFFQSDYYWKQIKASARGGAQPNVNATLLGALYFPLPSLSEQKRIAAIINEQLAAVERARVAAEMQLKAAWVLNIASLRELFDSPEIQKWKKKKLVEVTTRISKGESPGWQGFEYSKTGARFIRSENVVWGALSDEPRIFIPFEFHEKLSRSKLRADDVLINLVGASIGRACVMQQNFGEANVNQAVAVVSPTKEINPHYLVAFVISPQTQKHFQEVQVEMARPNISLENLRDLEVPLPPIEIQRHLSARIFEQGKSAEAIRNSLQEQLETINELPAALLRQAFTGKL